MNSKKACIFALLMLPNIVCASMITTLIGGTVSLICVTAGGFIGGGLGVVCGIAYADSTEKNEDGNYEPSEEERKNRTKKIIRGATFLGLVVGGIAGWQTGRTLMLPVRGVNSMIEKLRSP